MTDCESLSRPAALTKLKLVHNHRICTSNSLILPQEGNPPRIPIEPTHSAKLSYLQPPPLNMAHKIHQRTRQARPRVTVRQRRDLVIDHNSNKRLHLLTMSTSCTGRASHPLQDNPTTHRHHRRGTPGTVSRNMRNWQLRIIRRIPHNLQSCQKGRDISIMNAKITAVSSKRAHRPTEEESRLTN